MKTVPEIIYTAAFSYRLPIASPYINHFLSADSIVPGYANPQSLGLIYFHMAEI